MYPSQVYKQLHRIRCLELGWWVLSVLMVNSYSSLKLENLGVFCWVTGAVVDAKVLVQARLNADQNATAG